MLVKYARKDGISRNDLLEQSKSGENSVSVLYWYNLLDKVQADSEEPQGADPNTFEVSPSPKLAQIHDQNYTGEDENSQSKFLWN